MEACVEDTCETTQTGSNPASPAVDVASPALTADPVDVTLTITDATGKVLFDGRATVKTLRLQRDDPGCEGSTWHAMAVAKAHGKLRNEDFGKG